MNENQLRRLALLVALGGFFASAAFSAYSYYAARKAQQNVSFFYDAIRESEIACQEQDPLLRRELTCGALADTRESFNLSVNARDAHSRTSVIFLLIAIVVPIASLGLFLSLKWVFTGKLSWNDRGQSET